MSAGKSGEAEAKVMVKVVPSAILIELFQGKVSKLQEAHGEVTFDEYFEGFKAALNWATGVAESYEVEVPTEVMPKEEE